MNEHAAFCPACGTSSAREGQCLNRACKKFNGRLAQTHPNLLSLDRDIRRHAQTVWAHGGIKALRRLAVMQ